MLENIPRRLWLPITRSIGLAYLAFQIAWFLIPRSLIYELAVWELAVITGGCGAFVSALSAILFLKPRPWHLGVIIIVAALVGAILGLGMSILIGQILFLGPLFIIWAGLCWAAVGALIIRPQWPIRLNQVVTVAIAGVGLAGTLLAFYLVPRQLFDAETWGLVHGMTIPMLIIGTLLSYFAYLQYGRQTDQ